MEPNRTKPNPTPPQPNRTQPKQTQQRNEPNERITKHTRNNKQPTTTKLKANHKQERPKVRPRRHFKLIVAHSFMMQPANQKPNRTWGKQPATHNKTATPHQEPPQKEPNTSLEVSSKPNYCRAVSTLRYQAKQADM